MKQRTIWLPLLAFAALWGELIRELSFHWSTNPQYAFGWSVPVLLGFLLWEAWLTRPAPEPPGAGRGAVWALAAVLALSLLPARLFFEATPDWRFPIWVSTAAVTGLSCCALWLLGGRSWLRHFAFPLAFIVAGVPWPVKLELPMIRTLTDWVAVLTVNGVNLCGTPAVQRGSLLEISTGLVGIEEACSGIRSFQSALMASLFLGQLFTLRWRARLGLIALGAMVAFFCNVIRAGFLTIVADRRGMAEIAKWHDSAGYTILLICFAVLCVVAMQLRPGGRTPAPSLKPPAPLPPALSGALLAWVLLVAAGTELWYRSASREPVAWWRIEWPADAPQYTELPMESVLKTVQSDEGKAARWRDPEGRSCVLYFFRWLPGPTSSRMLARFHRPEFCLPAVGTRLVQEEEPETVESNGFRLPFRTYLFDQNGKPLHVFFCVWEDTPPTEAGAPPVDIWTLRTRLEAVRRKRRKLGQQVLEMGIFGAGSDEEMRAELHRLLTPLLRPDSTPAS